MAEYYKLSSLVRTLTGSLWEDVYFEIDDDKLRVICSYPQILSVLERKLEKVDEKEVKDNLNKLKKDLFP